MTKLVITADIHGSLASWLTLKHLLSPEDKLAIAGDLFDTRYGSYSDPDFQPETIRKDFNSLGQDVYYVYGNCDVPSFCPGYEPDLTFTEFNQSIYLHHGHRPAKLTGNENIIIQGHTHLCFLEQADGLIYMNPGSISAPRNGIYTYGIIDRNRAALVELKSGKSLHSIEF